VLIIWRLELAERFFGGYIVSYCPECEAVIDEEFEDVGEVFPCPECGVELEVTSVDPLEFDLAPVGDEDDEEDEYQFDDAEDDDEDEWDDESFEDDEDESDDEY
jgi:alpha-aminoadipate/glutamate carrier protein LysW